MKRIATLVFVLAFIGLAQPALLNFHRLRPQPKKQETFAVSVTRSIPRIQGIRKHFLETVSKATWYQRGLWFVNKALKDMTKNGGRDETNLASLLRFY